ncbi:MAG TPA: long-chain fatty acid--CoA ligase [Blastocatellia bacterium]|nr:long-chain fatty acid--CoA ligase [Blastocatellia bacterium]
MTGQSPYAQKPWLKHYDYWVPENATFPGQPLYHILQIATGLYRDRPASAFLGAQLTFGEVKSQADRLATALAQMGIGKGDRVGIMLPNCPQYVISFFAIIRLGAIVTNINPIYTAREVAVVANDSGMRAIITLDLLAPLVAAIKTQTAIETVITTSVQAYSASPATAGPTPEGTLSFSKLIADVSEPDLPRVEINAAEDVAVLQYTGGTTGTPKGAMLTHRNLFSNTVQAYLWGKGLSQPGNERYLMVIPYFHIYGQTVGILLGTWQGAMQIQIPKFDVNLLLEAIRTYQPTFFPSVPTLFISMINHPEAKNAGLEKVRRYNSGSAPLPVEVIEKFEKMTGLMLYEGYGLTEASPTTHSTPTLAMRKPGSIGLPFISTECKIVDLETGERELPVGEEGELCVRGPQVMKGYWNKPEETAQTLRDGWLYTGDIARMDEDGYFYIVQRKKDMLIVNGFNVYPNEVEEVLFTHPAVLEAAVIGTPDEYRGEVVKAFVVLKPGLQATAEELMEHCKTRLAKYKWPAVIEFAASLPKSAVGKVLRRELREIEAERRK